MKASPPVDGLAAIAPTTWRALGERLAAIGLSREAEREVERLGGPLAPALRVPIQVWYLRRRQEPLGVALRLLRWGDAALRGEVEAALGAGVVDALLGGGFLERDAGGALRARFCVRVVPGDAGFFVEDARPYDGAVCAFRPALDDFVRTAVPPSPVGAALDLACGSGPGAIALARHAARVVAIDRRERAASLARVGAAMSGAANVEVRCAEPLEADAGEAFDVVWSYPGAADVRRDAPRALVRAARARLRASDAARAVVAVDFGQADVEEELRAALEGAASRALAFVTDVDVDEHCAGVVTEERADLALPLGERFVALRSAYAEDGVTTLRRALVAVQPASKNGWIAAAHRRAPTRQAWPTATALARAFDARDLLAAGRPALLAARLRFAGGAIFASDGDEVRVRFADERAPLSPSLAADDYALLAEVQAARDVRGALQALARERGVTERAASPVIEKALAEGLLEVSGP